MGRTNSQVSRRYDKLVTKQAAKTKEQAATAKELTLELDMKVAYVLGQHFTCDLHVKHDCNARARTLNATHAGYNEYACANNNSWLVWYV